MRADPAIAFTFGTLVTDPIMYEAMKSSFRDRGFTEGDCEFLMVDNTSGRNTDAYHGLNQILDDARGAYVVLCHQDVMLVDDDRMVLERRLGELTDFDPRWAVASNAGGTEKGALVIRISDKHGANQRIGVFPARVVSVDENFMVIRRGCRVGFSGDLRGFHFYGADICVVADILGYTSYVIDFHLLHRGRGAKGKAFAQSRQAFKDKWRKALRHRYVTTTCDFVAIGATRPKTGIRGLMHRSARVGGRLRRSIDKRLKRLRAHTPANGE